MNNISKIKNFINNSKEIKASSAYVICSFLQNCIAFITLPIFTRILSTEEYGISTVYSSTIAVVIIFTTLNLPYGSFSLAMLKFEKDRDGYISAVNTICATLSILYFVLYFVFKDFWNDILGLPTKLMVLMGFEMLFNTSIQFWMGKTRYEYKYKDFIKVTLLTTVLGTFFSFLAVLFLPDKGINKVIANGLVLIAVGSFFMIKSIVKGKKMFDKEYWKYALSFNIPLIPYYLSQMIFNHSDRLMINKMEGKSEAALYGVAYSLGFIFIFVLNAINNAYVPWVYRNIKGEKYANNKKVSIVIAVIIATIILGVVAFAPEIIFIIAGEKYMQAVWVVPPVAISLLLLFYSQLFINIEFYFEEKSKLVMASILAAVVNILLNYIFINKYSFIAAGYTTLISYIIFAFCNYITMKKICEKKGITEKLYDCKTMVLIFVVIAAISSIFMLLYSNLVIRIFILIAIMIVLFINKRKVIDALAFTFSRLKHD